MTEQTADQTEDQTIEAPPKAARRRANPTAMKLAWLVALAIATLVPTTMLQTLVGEREDSQEAAIQSIARTWGPVQAVSGPTLMMPQTSIVSGTTTTSYVRLAPKSLSADIALEPQRRHRGFFETTVYAATLHVAGSFAVPDTIRTADGAAFALPSSGFLALKLSGLSGVSSGDTASVGDAKAPWQVFEETGADGCRGLGKVLVVPADFTRAHGTIPFEATLHLRGTRRFDIAALAKQTIVTIKGAWPSPSFTGDEPPAKTEVARSGFSGTWQIDGLGTPGLSTSACVVDPAAPTSFIGVDLVDAVPIYRVVARAAKYTPLFVVLAFTTYFVFELAAGVSITIVQYAMMAASLSLFALLLVALGEFAGYAGAYVASAGLVTLQASIFTASVARRIGLALGFAGLLAGLFGFLYVLLGLETLALLCGALALFVALSIVMAVTQHFHRQDSAPVFGG